MAKHRRDRHTRDATDISNRPLLRLPDLIDDLLVTPSSVVRQVEDRREWYPEPVRPAKALFREASRLVVGDRREVSRGQVKPELYPPASVAFKHPSSVAVCARRHERREVLHALRRTGRGGSKRKSRWDEFSHIRCK